MPSTFEDDPSWTHHRGPVPPPPQRAEAFLRAFRAYWSASHTTQALRHDQWERKGELTRERLRLTDELRGLQAAGVELGASAEAVLEVVAANSYYPLLQADLLDALTREPPRQSLSDALNRAADAPLLADTDFFVTPLRQLARREPPTITRPPDRNRIEQLEVDASNEALARRVHPQRADELFRIACLGPRVWPKVLLALAASKSELLHHFNQSEDDLERMGAPTFPPGLAEEDVLALLAAAPGCYLEIRALLVAEAHGRVHGLSAQLAEAAREPRLVRGVEIWGST